MRPPRSRQPPIFRDERRKDTFSTEGFVLIGCPLGHPANGYIGKKLLGDFKGIVRGIRGRVSLRTEFILRFDYGSVVPWVEHLPDEGLRAVAGPEMVVLHTPVPLHGRDFISVGEFDVGSSC